MGQYTKPHTTPHENEISLVDLLRFFFYNWKFLLLTTVGVSAIAISLSLLQSRPSQYQKQLTLSVRAFRIPVAGFPEMDDNQVNSIAVKFLENPKLDRITAQTKYEPTTKQIDVTLRSLDANTLNDAGSKVVRQVKTGFEQIVDKSINTTLFSLNTQIQKNKQILDQLKQQSTRFSPTNEFRLGAPETQQVLYIASISSLEFDKQYLEQAKTNLAEFTNRVISVQILAESDKPPQSRSPVQMAIVAVLASFIVAVLATILREQIRRLQHELSEQKPHGRPGV